jgi:signal transduction histidine kinase/CheY-like chemotaxis protein
LALLTSSRKYRKIGLRFRTTVAFWLGTVLTVVIVTFFFVRFQKNAYLEGLSSQGIAVVNYAKRLASQYGAEEETLFELVQDHVKNDRRVQYVVLTRPLDELAAQFGLDSVVIKNFAVVPDRLAGAVFAPKEPKGGTGSLQQNLLQPGEVYNYMYQYEWPDNQRGWIHVGLSTAKFRRDVGSMITQSLGVVLICFTISLLLALLFARRLLGPLLQLEDMVRRVANGDLEVRSEVRTGDEVEELAQSFNDMTHALRSTHDALSLARELAEKANQSKSQFLANICHEIRTPVNGMVGMLRLLENTRLTDRQKHYVGTAVNSSDTLLQVINDILDFSKIEAGKLTLERRAFNFQEAVESSLQMFQLAAAAQGIRLLCVQEGFLPSQVMGDELRVRQIIINLVGNALKFTRAGQVSVQTRMVGDQDECSKVEILVRDTGIGIPENKQLQLFQPFTQADSSTTRQFGGTGLGLAICADLVDLMEGEISVESQPGLGSTFRISVPWEAVEEGGESREISFNGRNMLVIESDEPTRKSLISQVQSWGFYAHGFATVREAIGLQERFEHVDVVLMSFADDDEMNGADLAVLKGEHADADWIRMHWVEDEPAANGMFHRNLIKPVMPTKFLDCLLGRASTRPRVGDEVIVKVQYKGRVLVCDDNEINRMVAEEILKQHGLDVDCVEGGMEALEAIRGRGYDMVFMDCQMPGLDGFETTRSLRAHDEKARSGGQLPIVALTALALPEDRDRCLAAGMDDYLSKPLEPAMVNRMIEKWLCQDPVESIPELSESNTSPIEEAVGAMPPRREGESCVLDFEALLKVCGAKRDVAYRILEIFVPQAEQDIAGLVSAVEEADYAAVNRLAHRLKGASANICARPFCEQVRILEQQGHVEEGDLRSSYAGVCHAFTELVQAIDLLRQAAG